MLAGNPREGDKLQYVKCWDDARSIFIRVGDSCPCQQKKPDGTTQPQFWCCGGANHMDLNYWWADLVEACGVETVYQQQRAMSPAGSSRTCSSWSSSCSVQRLFAGSCPW
jgi:hypothetical protein